METRLGFAFNRKGFGKVRDELKVGKSILLNLSYESRHNRTGVPGGPVTPGAPCIPRSPLAGRVYNKKRHESNLP